MAQSFMAQSVGQPGIQPVGPVILQATGTPHNGSSCGRVNEKLLAKSILGLGVIQVLIGCLCIIFNIAGIAMHSMFSFVGHGIWCSVFFILAGAFAIAAGRIKRSGYVVTCMILSILSAVMSVPMFSVASVGWEVEPYYRYIDYSCCNDYVPTDQSCCDYDKLIAKIAMHAILVVLGLLEGIVAIVTASFCCHGVCCCSQPGTVLVPGVQYVPGSQGMQMVVIQGQPRAVYPNNYQNYGQLIQPGLYQAGQQPTQPVNPPSYTGQQPAQPVNPRSYTGQQAPGFDNIEPPDYQAQPSALDYREKA